MHNAFKSIYSGKRIFITGNTGFKGSWLCLWLEAMGAKVSGYALKPSTEPNHFGLLTLSAITTFDDVRNGVSLGRAMQDAKPDIVFHLAAQPLVRYSYENPSETFETNVMGTVRVLDAVRSCPSVKAVVAITTDKVYENGEWIWGYRETERLGGFDPYSASKACAELVISSYRNSYFPIERFNAGHGVLLASARAGNVIGGGDWSKDRLVPDIAKAAGRGEMVLIRNPGAMRPWQHVLDCLSGYLLIGQKLLEGKTEFADAWNLGPNEESEISVLSLVEKMGKHWPELRHEVRSDSNQPHEATYLTLDCAKARHRLGWRPVWGINETVANTALWYRSYYANQSVSSSAQLNQYLSDAKAKGSPWANGSS